jgi:3-dehydroquinate synthase
MQQVIEQEFTVRYAFQVYFSRAVFDQENQLLSEVLCRAGKKRHRLLAFIDSGVLASNPEFGRRLQGYAASHNEIIDLVAAPVTIAGGEACKNDPAGLALVHSEIEKNRLCRQSFVLGIGGGAVLDLVGYGAATAHRGVRLIRMPSTVLAQNDAGVGVKNGVNGLGRKNFLGTFAPPYAVINDFDFLRTLAPRDLRAGIVEALKVAVIKDADFFNTLFSQRQRLAAFEPGAMESMIFRCAALHMEHIGTQGDPFEMGSARPLDFGHWAAHKLEELSAHTINHGEAVALGIALDSLYARDCGLLGKAELERILTLLEDLHLPLFHPALQQLEVLGALDEFREHLGGELSITLPAGIGRQIEVHEINIARMRRCIDLLAKRRGQRGEQRLPQLEAVSAIRLGRESGGKPLRTCPALLSVGSR